jgi:hypothetical protein
MIGDTIGITYNAVAKTLRKVNQDNFASDYYLEDSGLLRFRMKVAHTVPPVGKPGESHVMRRDGEHYDAGGIHLRTSTAWVVMRTDIGIQDLVSSQRIVAALLTAAIPANTDKMLQRES